MPAAVPCGVGGRDPAPGVQPGWCGELAVPVEVAGEPLEGWSWPTAVFALVCGDVVLTCWGLAWLGLWPPR